MKKITQKLLSSYPLIWNTRIYLMLPALLVLHVFYLLAGLLRTYNITLLNEYNMEPRFGSVLFAVLLGLLLMILWLVYYFRNNALKSLYPTNNGRLFAEYILILLVSIGTVSFIESYRVGSYISFNNTYKNVDVTKEANTVNIAKSFLAFDFNIFHKSKSCENKKEEHNDEPIAKTAEDATSVYVDNSSTLPDSLTADFSYLNYCNQSVSFYRDTASLLTERQLHNIARRWLTEGKKDSVKYSINQYLLLVKKYGGTYNFNVDKWVDELFSDNRFPVKRLLNSSHIYNAPAEEYIEEYQPGNSIETIERIRNRSIFRGDELFILFFGIGISILIFSFRITKTRTWFIALIGSCIWGIIFGLMGLGLGNDVAFFVFYLLLSIAFLVYALVNINRGTSKTAAGITFVWFQWVLPTLVPVIFYIIQKSLRVNGYDTYGRSIKQHWLETWINYHWTTIMYINVAAIIAGIALIIVPLARKWQAMPEE